MSQLTHIERRLSLRSSDSYIIDPIFPTHALHVVNGPPDIGKSTWTLQLLHDWEQGKCVLGNCTSHPCEWAYISLDRGLRDTDRTLRRLGLGDWGIPAYAIEEIIERNANKRIDLEPSIFNIVKQPRFATCKLFVIEGLQMLMPNIGRGQSINKAQGMWAIRVRDEILNQGITVIAVNHTPKASDASHDRENMLGSQALIGALGTTVMFALPPGADGRERGMTGTGQTDSRLVTIMPKNSPRLFLTYSRGVNGSFELDASAVGTPPAHEAEVFETPADVRRILDAHLTAYEGQAELGDRQIMKWATDAGLAVELAKAWIRETVKDGRMVREGQGKLRRTSVQ